MKYPIRILKCDQCGNRVEIYHKKRLLSKNIFCSKKCHGEFCKSLPNTKCIICGIPIHVKQSHLDSLKSDIGPCCSRECSAISRSNQYTSENNPNHKHQKNLDFIYNLTNDGAYVLGLVWSNGSIVNNTVSITQKNWEECPLRKISRMIFDKDLVKKSKEKEILVINDKNIVDHLISLGGIKRGKKSDVIEMPNIPEDKIWSFICGYFDGDGGFRYNYKYPEISITSNSTKILSQISRYWNVNYNNKSKEIYSYGSKALEICGKMYESCNLHNIRKYNYYLDILNWEPGIENCGRWKGMEVGKYKKLSLDALPPEKTRVTDTGYDVYAIEFNPFNEDIGVYIADMKIAIQPPPGFYFDLVGRSSLPVNNLHFLGGVGIIDKTYTGSLKMFVQKIDINKPLPDLPFKCGQLVLREFAHVQFVRVDKIDDTVRGEDGFGSTGKK